MYEIKKQFIDLMVKGIDYIVAISKLHYSVNYIMNTNKFIDFNTDGTCDLTKYFKNFKLSIHNIGIILQYQHDHYDFVFDTSTSIDLNELSLEFIYTILVNAMQLDDQASMLEKIMLLRLKLTNDNNIKLVDMNNNEIEY